MHANWFCFERKGNLMLVFCVGVSHIIIIDTTDDFDKTHYNMMKYIITRLMKFLLTKIHVINTRIEMRKDANVFF